MTIQELAYELDVLTPDMEALKEVIDAHKELDPKDEPLILSMSLLGGSIWGCEDATI